MIPSDLPAVLGFKFLLILTRVGAFVMMSPWFGDRGVPRMVKVGLVLALTYLWFSVEPLSIGATAQAYGEGRWLSMALSVAREALFGALLGYWMGLLILPVRIAGSYIGQEMGLNMATLADPSSPSQSNVLSVLLEMFAMVVFFSLDVHHVLLLVLDASFAKHPAGAASGETPITALTTSLTAAHHWGLQLAAPIAVCLFLILIVLALVMKAVPQLNLLSIGFSLRLAVGFVATLAFLPEVLTMMAGLFSQAAYFIPL